MVPLKKQDFLTNILKISNLFILEGGHTDPPLRLYLRGFESLVGEPPCGLPQLIHFVIFQDKRGETDLFSGEP